MTRPLILASASPRRRHLLLEIGLPFEVVVPHVDESPPPGVPPERVAVELAGRKARAVAALRPDALVLGADTVVAEGRDIIGKPANRADAVRILSQLSGSRHAVTTGVCLLDTAEGRELSDYVTTWVTMKPMTRQEIEAYVDSGEAYGKAGAYAIQETADRYVEKIEGSFSNVVGLPLERVRQMLAVLHVRQERIRQSDRNDSQA